MGIRLKYDAAAVVPTSNETTRKFGQQLVQGEQKRKYEAQQAGYDRMFTLARDHQQNQNQFVRDVRQNTFQERQAEAQFERQQKEAEAERQRGFLDEARKQQSGMIMEDIKNGHYDPATAAKLRQSILDETEALGNQNLDATMRAEALDKIRAKRLLDMAGRLEKPARPSREDQLREYLGEDGFNRYGDKPWVPDGKGGFTIQKELLDGDEQGAGGGSSGGKSSGGKSSNQEQQRFTSADDAFLADPKVRKEYMEEAILMERGGDASKVLDDDMRDKAAATARKNYEKDHGLGTPTAAVPIESAGPAVAAAGAVPAAALGGLGAAPAAAAMQAANAPGLDEYAGGVAATAQPEMKSILEHRGNPTAAPAAPGAAPVVPGKDRSILEGPITQSSPISTPADAAAPNPNSQLETLPDGTKVWVDQPAPTSPPAPTLAAPPTVVPPVQSPSAPPITTVPTPAAPPKSTGKLAGKPYAVVPGTESPQETEAREQIKAMPREQRISTLMPYDPQTKGQTLEQFLENPETKANYENMKKEGLVPTGNYREDMLAFLDEMLKHNVLSATQTKPEAYVGMRADEITDPKAKARVDKMPRPKNKADHSTIRSGESYVDPDGVIRIRS